MVMKNVPVGAANRVGAPTKSLNSHKWWLGLVATFALAAAAPGQVFVNGPSASLRSLTSWNDSPFTIQAMAETPAQIRYLVGVAGSSTYVMRLGKNGNLRFAVRLEGVQALSSCVTTYGENEVFVGTNVVQQGDGTSSRLFKLDDKGNVLIEKKLEYHNGTRDMKMLPNGQIAAGGWMRVGNGDLAYRPSITTYDRELTMASQFQLDGDPYSVTKVYVDADGNIYGNGGNYALFFVSFDGLYTTNRKYPYYNRQVEGFHMTGSTFDPVSGMAFLSGAYTSDYEYEGALVGFKVRYTPGQEPVIVAPYKFFGYNGSRSATAFVDSSGHVYARTANSRLFQYTPDPVTGELVQNFSHKFSNGAATFAAAPNGGFFALENGSSVQVFDNKSRLQQVLPMGDPALGPTGVGPFTYSPLNGEYFGLTTSSSDGSPVTFSADFLPGPDDHYALPFGTGDVLAEPAETGVLVNDAHYAGVVSFTCALKKVGRGLTSVSLNSDGSFTANRKPGFQGEATFTYERFADGVSDGVVTVTIDCAPIPPVANDDTYSVAKGSGVTVLDVLSNDTPAGELTVSAVQTNPNATIIVSTDRQTIKFKPKPGFVGDVSFTYKVRRTTGGTDTGSVVVHVG